MCDDLRTAALSLFAAAFISGWALHRAERAIVRELKVSAPDGHFDVRVEPKGLLGALTGQASKATIRGQDFALLSLPLTLSPGDAPAGTVHKLSFEFYNVHLKNAEVKRFSAELRDARLDLNRVVLDERLRVLSSKDGPVEAEVDESGLLKFISRKYKQFQFESVTITPTSATVSAETVLLGIKVKLEAEGDLVVRGGRYVEIANAKVKINGRPSSPGLVNQVLAMINPLVAVDEDLGLGKAVTLTSVELKVGAAIVKGRVRVPEG